MFDDLDGFIESQCNDTKHNNACDHHIQLEYLGAVDDQISQSPSCGKKFSDNDPHQGEPDIYLCRTEQNWDGAWEDNL